MPVILGDADYDVWLTGTPEQALELLKPYPADEMRAYPVSKQVNSSRDDVSQMIEVLDETPEIVTHRPGERKEDDE
jgi:putative SOS response-associated peptidase YedK